MKMNCPLCHSKEKIPFHQDKTREYFRCCTCQLVFVPPEYFLSAEEEKKRYDLHQNSPDDPGYRRFLGRMLAPLLERLSPGSIGLDFGSGPGPTFSVMLEEAGHKVTLFDLFYAKDPVVWEKKYDFITATEVVEHLHHPGEELKRLWSCLKPGGILGIMTKLVQDPEAFTNWHYKRDLTHVCFFSQPTFSWWADCSKGEVIFVGRDVIFLVKEESTPLTFPRN